MEKKKNTPKLRFPEFTGEWEEKKLGEITNWASGGTPSKENLNYWNGDIPWITASSMRGIEYSTSELKITEEGLKNGSKLAPKNSLLILVRGSMLFKTIPIGIAVNDVAFNQDVKSIDVFKDNKRFILYWFFASESLILNQVTGTGIGAGKLDLGDLKNMSLSLPLIPEQTKIATFLTAVDDKLTQLKKKKTLLEQYKKGVMQKLFSQELRFKDDNNQDFPDWQEKTLGELTFKVDKKNKKNIQYPIYSINNINGFIPQSDQFDGMDSNKRGYDISLYKIIERNTFAYNPARINVGSLGYSGNLHDIIISSLYVCFKTVEDVYDNYLLQYFTTKQFNKAVLTNVEGGVREYLFYENFSRIDLSLPSLPEQQKIANFLSSIDEKISHCSAQIEKMEAWKKGLLQQMFC